MNELAIQEAKAISANWNMVVFQAVNADNGDTYQNLFNKFLNEHDGSRIEYIKLLSDFIEFAQGQI